MIKILDIPIYKTTVVLMVESKPREWEEFYGLYKDLITESDYDGVLWDIQNHTGNDGFTALLDRGDYAVYVRHKDGHGDIAHEIFHVANKILCSRGVYHESDGEAWAYLIGYITEQFYKMLDGKCDDIFTVE